MRPLIAVPGYEHACTPRNHFGQVHTFSFKEFYIHFGSAPDQRPESWQAIIGCPCIMNSGLQLN